MSTRWWPCPGCLKLNHPGTTTCTACGLSIPVGGVADE